MTTREQIIAAALKAAPGFYMDSFDDHDEEDWARIERFYAIAFEAGRAAEREETNRRPLPDNTTPYIRARGDMK